MNIRTLAIIRFCRILSGTRSSSTDNTLLSEQLIFVKLLKTIAGYTSTSSSLTRASTLGSFTDSFGYQRNFGPLNHLSTLSESSTVSPLDASSAGLSLVFTYVHCSFLEKSLIFLTRFATKVRNRRTSFWIYPRTIMLSTQ